MTPSSWVLLASLVLGGSCSGVRPAASASSERNCSATPPILPPTAVNTSHRLWELRQAMAPFNISAYIIPGTDAHLSEYIAERDNRLAWISGFTGSAGTAVVTKTRAVLWTDSRYWVQAERQMDCNWELVRDSSISSITDWLISDVPDGKEIGFDPFLFSFDTFKSYDANLAPAKRVLKSLQQNLVDEVWTERPPVPKENIFKLPDNFIERTWQMKVEHIRQEIRNNAYKPTAVLLSALDETAWLFNLRGNDIPYNPFFYSYTLLTLDEIWLFVHMDRVPEELKAYLNVGCYLADCVQLLEYDTVRVRLGDYVVRSGVRVWIGTEYTTRALSELITPEEKVLTSAFSPVLITKAVKDATEQRILKDAHIRDAVAVMQLLAQLENTVPKGTENELSAANTVNGFRQAQKHSAGPSFETISASGPNAALAHYSPTNETYRNLTVGEMYLLDSGGQYLDGTTDITRTVHWGTPTELQKEAYTRVLMGCIEISRTIFPPRTRGVYMEMLGRRALWEVGLNYGHGTGHGVGNYFGVHEWPVGFQSNNIPFEQGMFTSIEPGYYKENEFGIRIEDVAVVVPAATKHTVGYLTFETVSLVPYDRKLIDISIMSPEQLNWLDAYYQKIRTIMGPELERQGLTDVHAWMMKNTEPLRTPTAGAPATLPSLGLTLVVLAQALLQHLC
ncbi:hypothetical protein AGOR_G00068980 [Albula goreensis]|uniref:Xaa-Pro aminopeptidase 2 n=1 Tax=Albula goreensis TaxID=1534307 RepID=A0A8T3DM62_9TELE|nr:hypothetical protein AGOR_G00068980 [Albula goreensis]